MADLLLEDESFPGPNLIPFSRSSVITVSAVEMNSTRSTPMLISSPWACPLPITLYLIFK